MTEPAEEVESSASQLPDAVVANGKTCPAVTGLD